jgi:peptidyl-prolyl cis-trans isomerase C
MNKPSELRSVRARAEASIVAMLLLVAPLAHGQPQPAPASAMPSASAPSTVLLRSGDVTVTRADYDTELARLPENYRGAFGVEAQRVDALLGNLLVQKVLAAQAREAGIDREAPMQRRIAAETDKLLAAEKVARIEADARRAFDAQDNEARAREIYLQRRDTLRTPEQVAVTHILFDAKKRTEEEATRLAKEARARIVAGENMEALAKALSEDPSAQRNNGRLDFFVKERMDPPFSKAAFALSKVGDLSEPVVGRFGVHIIRLDGRKEGSIPPFEQVRASILDEMRKTYVDRVRNDYANALRTDPKVYVNKEAVDALLVQPDYDALRRANRGEAAPSK